MNYISTKELAERWEVSTSRIVRLAKEGRIPGAKLIGKSWVFPPDTRKPTDNRRRAAAPKTGERGFRFPLYLYYPYTREQIDKDFTEDERSLYEAECLYFNGKYQESYNLMKRLLNKTKDRYVRFGVLYHICQASIFLHRFREAYLYYNDVLTLCSEETLHKNELRLASRDLEATFVGNGFFIEEYTADMDTEYPQDMRAYLVLISAYSDLMRSAYKGLSLNPDPYELFCRYENDRLSPLTELTLRMYLSIICNNCGRTERSIFHFREAARIAEENNLEYLIFSYFFQYKQDLYTEGLRDTNPAQLERMKDISKAQIESFHAFLTFAGKSTMLQLLDSSDASYVTFAIMGLTNKEIADMVHLSINTVSKKYSLIFEKTGTHSKSELARMYSDSMRNY